MENISMKKPENTGGKKALLQIILFIALIVLGTFALKFILDSLGLF
ncbi:MAG: hypothetical protein KJ666_06920 [Bacteroidetes bacterium]|nr:hypothetical protein [Bacteroidota bacterium]